MRVQGVLLVVAAILVLLWVIALQDPDEPALETTAIDDVDAPEDPSIEVGRPELEPAPAVPEKVREAIEKNRFLVDRIDKAEKDAAKRIVVKGRVTNLRGLPVEGALVFQIGKGSPQGTDRTMATAAVAQADGSFAFSARPLEGTWIGVRANGYLHAFIAGEDVVSGHPLPIRLEDALELRVLLVDTAGEPVADENIRVMPVANRGVPRAYPGPESLEQERFAVTDENGIVTFSFQRDVPIVVMPELEGGVTIPKDRWLPSPQGTVEFVTAAGITLSVKRVDPTSGREIYGPAWVTVRDDRGRQVDHLVRDESEGGRLQMELPLRPGQYVAEVYQRALEPQAVPVTVTNPGETIEIVVSAPPLAEAAVLELTLPQLSAEQRKLQRGSSAPLAFVRRMGDGFDRLGWQRVEVMKWKRDERRGEASLRPGDYDVVVVDRIGQGVGSPPRVRLRPGERHKARVTIQDGTTVTLTDILPADMRVRSIAVAVQGMGWFPPAGSSGLIGVPARNEEDVLNSLDSFKGKGVVLGPYPGPVVVHVTDWEGQEHTFPVR